jgi:hypothetical protein
VQLSSSATPNNCSPRSVGKTNKLRAGVDPEMIWGCKDILRNEGNLLAGGEGGSVDARAHDEDGDFAKPSTDRRAG